MSEAILSNQEHVESIFVMNDADAPVVGLVQGNFDISLSLNGAVSAVIVTITEVNAAANPGEYSVTWTPNQVGTWVLRIRQALYEPMGWVGQFEAVLSEAETGAEELFPSIVSVVSNATEVEAFVYGAETIEYQIELLGSTGVTEDTETRTGSGKVLLTPTTSGPHTISIIGVDGDGNVITDTATQVINVPAALIP